MTYFKNNSKLKILYLCITFLLALSLTISPFVTSALAPSDTNSLKKIAVTPADYDDIGEVLENLGFQAEQIEEEDLTSLTTLSNYDAVYINCSATINLIAEDAASTISDYVKNGGIIYASDWANTLIEAAFPNKINFYEGENIWGASDAESAQIGQSGEVEAEVTDPGLQEVLGKKKIKVNFDLDDWAVIDSVNQGVNTLIKGPAKIIDYSNNDQDWENLDFENPENLDKLEEIDLSKTLDDKPFVVSFTEGKGQVLYTTFHNESQNTSDMENILDWFVIWTKAAGLTEEARNIADQDNTEVLQEIIDSINKNETKNYYFNASGKDDFKITLNFSGSAISLKITDSENNKVIEEDIANPPYTKKIDAEKGKYKIQIKGTDIPEENYPFVVTATGNKKAITQDTDEEEKETVQETKTEEKQENLLESLLNNPIIWGTAAGTAVLLILVIIIVVARKKKKKKAVPTKNAPVLSQTKPPSTIPDEQKPTLKDIHHRKQKPDTEDKKNQK